MEMRSNTWIPEAQLAWSILSSREKIGS